MGRLRALSVAVACGALAFGGCAAGDADAPENVAIEKKEDDQSSIVIPQEQGQNNQPSAPNEVSPPANDGGTDGGSDAAPGSCAPANTCAAPVQMGSMRVDEGNDTLTGTGSSTTWFKVRATEGDTGGPGGKRMKLRATLTSPPGTNFDLYVYLANDGSAVPCTGVSASAVTSVSPESAQVEWGETNLFNGDEDDRWVMIEVRYVSGACSASNKFNLNLVRW